MQSSFTTVSLSFVNNAANDCSGVKSVCLPLYDTLNNNSLLIDYLHDNHFNSSVAYEPTNLGKYDIVFF